MKAFLKYLQRYNKDILPVINQIFNDEKKHASEIAPFTGQMVDDYRDFLTGGKKLRGTLIALGYEIYGGKNRKQSLIASTAIEIVHSFLLIHDDIMDQDPLRRGKPTIHTKYAKEFGEHIGLSLAIDIGDEGAFLAFNVLNSVDLPKDRLSKATRFLSHLLLETGIGQALDIYYESQKRFSAEDVLRVHRYKTAEYTIPGPLSIGAILAGASEKTLSAIKEFGMPLGIAFQIRDDELGMFSTEEELGKPVDSDLREAKVTLLIVKAFELAKGEDLKFLKYAYGNKNLKLSEIEKVREIIRRVGALDYSSNYAKNLVTEAKKLIPKVTKNPKYQVILTELADFTIERSS